MCSRHLKQPANKTLWNKGGKAGGHNTAKEKGVGKSTLERARSITQRYVSVWRMAGKYFFFFCLSAVCLVSLVLWSFDTTLTRMEQERLQTDLQTYTTLYTEKGLDALLATFARQYRIHREAGVYIHLTDERGQTVWLTIPREFDSLSAELFSSAVNVAATPSPPACSFLDLPVDNDITLCSAALFANQALSGRVFSGFVLSVGQSSYYTELLVELLSDIFLVALAGIVFLGIAGGILFAHRIQAPLAVFTATVSEVAQGTTGSRVLPGKTIAELTELAAVFNRMLERTERLIVTLRDTVNNVSHDMRTPLARMKARIESALLATDNTAIQQEALISCAEEIERMDALLTALFDVAQAETGQMRLHLTQLPVATLLEEVIDLYELPAEEKDISLELDASVSTAVEVRADRSRLLQALANVVDNAVKYTPHGGSVVLFASEEKGQTCIRVQDSGPGIPPAERGRIFEKLYRMERSRSGPGLGLGLSLVAAVISAHGGQVFAEDAVPGEPDKGSCFVIML